MADGTPLPVVVDELEVHDEGPLVGVSTLEVGRATGVTEDGRA